MKKKKVLALLLVSAIFMSGNFGNNSNVENQNNFISGRTLLVQASGNYDSTNAQLYHDTVKIAEYDDGNAIWSYSLNKATREGYTDNITDLKFISASNGTTEIAIPSHIDGVPVMEIGKEAFSEKTDITTVKIPDTVTRICDKAFYGCTKLTTVTFEDANTVGVLGEKAFANCSSLKDIVLGNNLMKDDTTGNYAFENCTSLENVTVNNIDAISIQEGSFNGCSNLKSVSCFTDSATSTSIKIGNSAFVGTALESLFFASVTEIGDNAFENCEKLKNVTFKKSATLGTKAFYNAFKEGGNEDSTVSFQGLKSIIGDSTFQGCVELSEVTFSDKSTLINLSKSCFEGTSSLNELELRGKNVNVSLYALEGMQAKDILFLNTDRTEIEGNLFLNDNNYCEHMSFASKEVYIANSEQIKNKSFEKALALKKLSFLNSVSILKMSLNGKNKINDMLFYNPMITGSISDQSGAAYNAYGYWRDGEQNLVLTGNEKIAKKSIQKAIKVEYMGSTNILKGAKISTASIKVSNILYDDTIEKDYVKYTSTGDKYQGFVIDKESFDEVGNYTVNVSYGEQQGRFNINVVAPTATPTMKITATPTPEQTTPTPTTGGGSGNNTTPTPGVTQGGTVTPTPTNTVATPTPIKVTGAPSGNKVTAMPTPTKVASKKDVSLTLKSSLKGIKLCKKSAKTKYKVLTKKNVKLTPKAGKQQVYYQIVKKGSKLKSSKWKKANKTITLKKQGNYCVYFKYKKNGKTITVKTNGMMIDKTAPSVEVDKTTHKLKVKDNLSGIKYIKVDGKYVKNNFVLQKGMNKIVVVDKAGNKKNVSCNIG